MVQPEQRRKGLLLLDFKLYTVVKALCKPDVRLRTHADQWIKECAQHRSSSEESAALTSGTESSRRVRPASVRPHVAEFAGNGITDPIQCRAEPMLYRYRQQLPEQFPRLNEKLPRSAAQSRRDSVTRSPLTFLFRKLDDMDNRFAKRRTACMY